ncbi:MAG: S41 family peptidase [Bacteroidales bacterium]|nr:S41 family peptidase [Bacteroidales bacterium]
MEPGNKGISVYIPVIVAVAIVAGILVGRFYSGKDAENRFVIVPRANKLDHVLNYIEDSYVDEVDRNDLVENTIPKILVELDPHSQYIPAKELQQVIEPLEGNFSGVGIQFNMLDDTLVVIQTIANGPSQKAGILAGDRIVYVNKEPVAGIGMPSDSIVKLLRGSKGTTVEVTIVRRDVRGLLDFEIVRDDIPLYSVDVDYMIDDDIGYIKLNKFSATTEEEFVNAVQRLRSQGIRKLILDLRENGGGYMNGAVFIADQLLAGNELIVYTEGKARAKEEYRSIPGGICTDLELEILIDENSASASEILAGAIQDNDRGRIIGRRSFGKGLVQEQKPLPDGSAIRLTVARYYTPTGRSIQKPYTNNLNEYYSDVLFNRRINGDLEVADSNKFSDTLKYITPGGNVVYGGGGIMPDLFIPIDTTGISDYYIEIRNKGLLYRFALQYSDENRQVLSGLAGPEDFVSHLERENVLGKFESFASMEGVTGSRHEINTSGKILTVQLCAYIARNFIDNQGFYPIIQEIDNTLLKAIEEFKR